MSVATTTGTADLNFKQRETCVGLLAARGARALLELHPPSQRRAQGKPDADRTRGRAHKKRTNDPRFNRIIPAFPARMGYGLLRALPGDRAVLPPSPCGLTIHPDPVGPDASPQDLTPASGRQDHTTSPSATVSPEVLPDLVRSGEFRQRRFAAPFVRAPSDRSRQDPPCDPVARPTLSRPSHPTARS